MSEEHPPGPTTLMNGGGKYSSLNNEDGLSSLDKSKIISYRPLKSVCDSENSLGVEGERAILASDSDSGHQGDSKSSLRQVNSNLYRYVTSFGGTTQQQIETFNQASSSTINAATVVNKNGDSNLKEQQ